MPNISLSRGKCPNRIARIAVPIILLLLGALLYVCNFPFAPARASTLRFERYVELPRSGLLSALDYLAIRSGHLFVASISSGAVIDVPIDAAGEASAEELRSFPGKGRAHGIAVAGEDAAFVTRAGADIVDMFDPTSLTLLHSLSVPAGPDAILADPASGLVYVASGDANLGTVIDARNGRFVGTVHLSGEPEFAVLDPVTHLVYQNLVNLNAFAAISLQSREVVASWPLSGCESPSGMALDAEARQLFVVCSGNSRLAIVSLSSHQVTATLPVGRLSDTVGFDATLRRLYVAGGAGELVVMTKADGATYRIADRIQTRIGSHTIAIDPATHKVYLASSGIIAAPRVLVFSPI